MALVDFLASLPVDKADGENSMRTLLVGLLCLRGMCNGKGRKTVLSAALLGVGALLSC